MIHITFRNILYTRKKMLIGDNKRYGGYGVLEDSLCFVNLKTNTGAPGGKG